MNGVNGVNGTEEKLDIAEIKQYNAELKEYNAKFAETKAKMDFNRNEVIRLCEELSRELGTRVTPDNLEQVYGEYKNKIVNTLETGREILSRIKQEEQAMNGTNMNTANEYPVNSDMGLSMNANSGFEAGGNPFNDGYGLPQMFDFGNRR